MMKQFRYALVFCVVSAIGCGGGSGNSKVTRENFLKIESGMNHSDVTTILGEPTKKMGESPAPQIWTWKDGSKEISVVIGSNGKVEDRTQTGLE
jgi:hypothetical protein